MILKDIYNEKKRIRMKQFLILIFIGLNVFSLYGQTNSEEYDVELIPEELLIDANAVVRKHEIRYNTNSLGSATMSVYQATTLLNNLTKYNELAVSYSSAFSKVKKVSAALYDSSGKLVKKLRKRDFEDVSGTGYGTLADNSRVTYAELNHNEYPYTIVFDYEIDYNCVPYYPNWNIVPRTKTAIQNSSYTMTLSEKMGIRYKAHNIDIEPIIEKEKGKTVYKWKATNIPAFRPNGFLPKYDEIFPKVSIEPTFFSMANKKGSKASWKEMGAFYLKLNKGRDKIPASLAEKIQSLTANVKTDAEKIKLIYKYLQDNTRYVSVQLGIGGWQTFEAKYVDKNKYGDCKALTNYMQAMLKSIGITSYGALVQSGSRIRKIDEDFPADVFNHIILNIPQEGTEDIWLECTSKYAPMGYLSSFTENRYALLITPKGGKLVKTPRKTHEFHRKINRATVSIGEKGEALATIKSETFEDEHDDWRDAFYELKEKEQREYLEEQIDLSSFNVTKLEIKLSDEEPRADVNYELEIRKLAKKTSRRIFLIPNLLSRKSYIPSAKERKIPIQSVKGYTHIDTIIYTIPEGYIAENVPIDNFDLCTYFGEYNIDVKLEGNQLTYIRRFQLFAFSKPKEEYEALRNFYVQVVKMDKMKIVLVRT